MSVAAFAQWLLDRLRTDRYSVTEHGDYARGWFDALSHVERLVHEQRVARGLTELRRATTEPPHDVAWSDLAELGEGEG